ncbi:MAG: nucleotidyltransferase domain-containing protein [Patescibacteria group bacterium]
MGEYQERFNEPEMRQRIVAIAEKYQLSLVLLFGSQATGKTHKQSDYDVAYLSERPLALMEESSLIVDLMPVFQTLTVDLVNLHNASPLLLKKIAERCMMLYEKERHLFAQFRIYAYKRYMEAQRLFRMRDQQLNRILHRAPATIS